MGRRAGVPAVPDGEKNCVGCGERFTHYELPRRLSEAGWAARKFCGEPCRREHDLTHGRVSGVFVERLAARKLSLADHHAFWTERFTHAEICEMAAALDSVLGSDEVAA